MVGDVTVLHLVMIFDLCSLFFQTSSLTMIVVSAGICTVTAVSERGMIFASMNVASPNSHIVNLTSSPDKEIVLTLLMTVISLPKCVKFRFLALIVSLIPRGLLVLVGNSFEGCFRAWECGAVAVRDPFQFHELFDRHGDAYVTAIISYDDSFERCCNQFVV